MNRYHGIFAKLAELNIYEGGGVDLYTRSLADFYARFVGEYVGDIPIFEKYLGDTSMRVLDLACGTGRIGISLGRIGYHVDGVELSTAMLQLGQEAIEREAVEVRERLRLLHGDMTSFALPGKYDLILIGVTSISLLLTKTSRQKLFACVAKHLKPQGKFVFDFLDLSEDRWKSFDGVEDVWSAETDEGVDFGIIGQRFYPNERLFVFNVYREMVGWNGETTRTIGSSTKAWLDADELVDEMVLAGLTTVDRYHVNASIYLVATLGVSNLA